MKTARLFTNGRSQAVRLPKECRFAGTEKEVYVHKVEGIVILISKRDPWKPLLQSLPRFTDDFLPERNQPRRQERRPGLK
jgi:antitoxin VapB